MKASMDNLQTQSMSNANTRRLTTYDFLMAQNVLGKFNIHLSNDEIFKVIQEKNDVNYLLICAPIENIYNQMIFSQIKSYELFVQKRMIDYVIGTAPTPDAVQNAEGADISYPEVFVHLQERFQTIQAQLLDLDNQILQKIGETNSYIKKFVMKNIVKGIKLDDDMIPELQNKIQEFVSHSQELRTLLLSTREEWKLFAGEVCKTLSELGGYYVEEDEDLAQRAELSFFRQLGVSETEKNAI